MRGTGIESSVSCTKVKVTHPGGIVCGVTDDHDGNNVFKLAVSFVVTEPQTCVVNRLKVEILHIFANVLELIFEL